MYAAHATRQGGEEVARGVGDLVFGARPRLHAFDGGKAGRRQPVANCLEEDEEKTATG